MAQEIMVSVCFITYNHKQYIRQALDSILEQETNFAYEIIIHDDASTDGTTQIVKEYASKYPEIIVPLIQEENQYSKSVDLYKKYIADKIRGKYVAMLEGDDYWCDINKLQTQVDFLEEHQDYIACVHNTKKVDCRNGKEQLLNKYTNNRDIELQDILENGEHSFHINTVLYRSEVMPMYISFIDFLHTTTYDLVIRLFLITYGKIFFLARTMSVYRYYAIGSWTKENEDSEHRKQLYQRVIAWYRAANEYQGKKNDIMFQKYIRKYEGLYYEVSGEVSKLLLPEYKEFLSEKPLWFKFSIWLQIYCPVLYTFLKKMIK